MLHLALLLLVTVASNTSDHATNAALRAVRDAAAEIRDLPASLTSLTLRVLLLTLLLEALSADEATDGLLAGTDGLVPAASLALGVVGSNAAAADGEPADVATGVGEVVLGVALGLLVLTLRLRWCVSKLRTGGRMSEQTSGKAYFVGAVAGDGSQSRLSHAASLRW